MQKINLTQGKEALVDDHWYDHLISQGSWCFDTGYAVTRTNKKKVYMHHIVRPLSDDGLLEVDHIDSNKLNNQEANLRLVTRGTNIRNTGPRFGAKYKGTKLLKTGRFAARAQINGKETHIGVYATELEAAKAYDKTMVDVYGKKVYLNFPEDYAS